jgi:hypothetical protein
MWKQLVNPNTKTEDYAGMCLQFAQKVYNAPVKYATAWASWQATPNKHTNRNLPNASTVIWFDHWGTYNNVYGQYGHVCAWVPGLGFLSSPTQGYGQQIFSTIEDVEKSFNAKFVGWTETLNGLQIIEHFNDNNNEEIETSNMYIRNKITGQIGLFGSDVADGIHIFSSIDEYNAWRGIVIAYNTTVPAQFQKFVPVEITNTAAMLNVDQVGWDVAVQVHSR